MDTVNNPEFFLQERTTPSIIALEVETPPNQELMWRRSASA
jgi:hypothetical protein